MLDNFVHLGLMFGKHFASMYTGSMFGKPAIVFAVWGYAISHQKPSRKDKCCYVELNPALIASTFSTTKEEVISAIKDLCGEDPVSRSDGDGGRRLVPVSSNITGGPVTYRVVNGMRYRNILDDEERRLYFREHKRLQRDVQQTPNVQVCPTVSTQAEAEAEVEEEGDSEAEASEMEFQLQAQEAHSSEKMSREEMAHQIYHRYPKKVAKQPAIKAIMKALGTVSHARLMERTMAYADAVSRWPAGSEEFIPYPSTWFNQARYDDDPKTWERTAPVANVPPWKRRELLQSQIDELTRKVQGMPDGTERVSEHKRLTAMHEELAKIQ